MRFPWGDVSYLEWLPEDEVEADPSTVLPLHGGGFDSAELSWAEAGPALARAGFHVLAPDHPGFGETPPAPWVITQRRLVTYVGELLDALGVERCAIGGIPMGGGMAIGHVLERPWSVTGAILLGSYGLMDHQFIGWWAKPAHTLIWMMLRVGALDALMRVYGHSRALMESSIRDIVRSSEHRTPELIDSIMRAARQGEGVTAFAQWQRDESLWNRLRTNYSDCLGTFPYKVLLIHGDQGHGVPLEAAQRAAALFPQARLVAVPGAGHWVQRDRPDVVLPDMIDFLCYRE